MAQKLGEAYLELREDAGPLRAGFRRAEGLVRSAVARMQRGLDRFAGWTAKWAKRVGVGLVAALTASVALAGVQENAEVRLAAALEAKGDSVDALFPKLKAQAAAIQELTVYGDEFLMGLMAQALNLGATADGLDKATKDAIGLARALDMDLNTALRYSILATQGEFTMLQRYIPALRQAESATEKLAIVQDMMNRGWHIAQAEAKTTTGQLQQMKNTIGDAAEVIGAALLPAIADIAVGVKDWVNGPGGTQALEDIVATIDAITWGFQNLPDVVEAAALKMSIMLAKHYEGAGYSGAFKAFEKHGLVGKQDDGDLEAMEADLKNLQGRMLNNWRQYYDKLDKERRGGGGKPTEDPSFFSGMFAAAGDWGAKAARDALGGWNAVLASGAGPAGAGPAGAAGMTEPAGAGGGGGTGSISAAFNEWSRALEEQRLMRADLKQMGREAEISALRTAGFGAQADQLEVANWLEARKAALAEWRDTYIETGGELTDAERERLADLETMYEAEAAARQSALANAAGKQDFTYRTASLREVKHALSGTLNRSPEDKKAGTDQKRAADGIDELVKQGESRTAVYG